ncbi:sigma-70 family RNA polymerase sigma factor [bacterium]|nr:sigma-70 family RNA polymerase sigma factor [bacterium]
MSPVSSLAQPLSASEFPDFTQLELRSLVGIAKRLLGCDHLAHDAVQEALLALSQQPEYPVKPIAWLTRAVIHRSRHLRRCVRRRKHHEHKASTDCELHGDCDNPLHVAIAHEVGSKLTAVRDSLSPEQRRAVELSEKSGQDYQLIADTLGVPVGTVRSRLSRARAALRAALRPFAEVQ